MVHYWDFQAGWIATALRYTWPGPIMRAAWSQGSGGLLVVGSGHFVRLFIGVGSGIFAQVACPWSFISNYAEEDDIVYVGSHDGAEHIKGSDCEILTGEGFLWKAAKDGQVPEGAVQVNISRHKQIY